MSLASDSYQPFFDLPGFFDPWISTNWLGGEETTDLEDGYNAVSNIAPIDPPYAKLDFELKEPLSFDEMFDTLINRPTADSSQAPPSLHSIDSTMNDNVAYEQSRCPMYTAATPGVPVTAAHFLASFPSNSQLDTYENPDINTNVKGRKRSAEAPAKNVKKKVKLSHSAGHSATALGVITKTTPPASASALGGVGEKENVRVSASADSRPTPKISHRAGTSKRYKRFLCPHPGCGHRCWTSGDLQRHLECKKHQAPGHICYGCKNSYTRIDALRRHHEKNAYCAREHKKAVRELSGKSS